MASDNRGTADLVDTRAPARLTQKWRALSPLQRRLAVAAAAIDTAAKTAAVIDLARRPADAVRGPKVAWAVALPVVNSAGLLPAAYFLFGRRR
ncbi:hypothetical protein [Flexivirga oryzae]|uniref:DUF5652 domain-containing protein n=1 Tax=Flexivirga oryzae TaxID=1794944 RepID=A0A839N5H4_9MICO|nr:hypothetical protein [Flexivirga oryzae]MBB2891304.1 hypothetical protein [Flexivirga oryzae]